MNAEKLIQKGVMFTKQWFSENGVTFIRTSDRYVEGKKDGKTITVVVIQRDHKPGRGKLTGDPEESVMLDHIDYSEKVGSFFTSQSQNYVVIPRTYREGERYFPEQAYFVLVPAEIVEVEFAKRKPKSPTSKKTCNIGFSQIQIRKWKDKGVRYYRMILHETTDIFQSLY